MKKKIIKKPLKIAHVTEAWVGGIATYIDTLIDHQLQSDEFEQIYLIYSGNRKNNIKDSFSSKDVKLYSYESSRNPIKFFSISKNLSKILNDIKPDVVHLHSTFPGVYGRLIKEFPTVYCPHGWAFSQDINNIKKIIYANVERFLAKKTDAIVNISMHEQEMATKFNVKSPRNVIIRNGVRDIITSNCVPNLPIKEDTINVCFIGRLDNQKGFDLIEPFFRNLTSNIHLYVIGETERDSKKKYENCKNITFLGWIDHKDIDNYLSLFDVVIVPSRYEGFGLVAIEAMRNSKPVIVSNKGALPELVIPGFNGFHLELHNINYGLNSIFEGLTKQILLKMGENARKTYISAFTSDIYCQDITVLYQKVLGA